MITKVHLLFDARMTLHHPLQPIKETGTDDVVECFPYESPNRICRTYKKLLVLEHRLLGNKSPGSTFKGGKANRRFLEIECLPASRQTIELVHTPEHYDRICRTRFFSEQELRDATIPNDLYFNRFTFLAASLACGGVVQCVDAVTSESTESTRAIALVRPPGHHAEKDEAMGFCYFNNIAVAAKHALHTKRAERVFILDWDIHHGNGIQDLTYDDPNIFYLSIHRASFRSRSKQWFYPGTGRHTEVGKGAGAGTNLNIVWGQGGMGNEEYAAAFREAVLPLMQSFRPDLIMIACGLDAAKGDLLGDCGLTSDMYYTMTRSLFEAMGPEIPIVVVLEGGYNLDVSAECMESVALALFDEPLTEEDHEEESILWSSASILPLKRGKRITSESDNGLGRYWSHDQISSVMKKSTRLAVASIKRSVRALANKGTCLAHYHFLSSIVEPVDACHGESNDGDRLPVKKRKIRDEEAQSTLLSPKMILVED